MPPRPPSQMHSTQNSRPPPNSGTLVTFADLVAVTTRVSLACLTEAVFEDPDGGFCSCSGRFSGELHDEAGRVVEVGPQAVLLEDALTWAGARSSVVVIRVGPRHDAYSAGALPPPNLDLPDWPAGGLKAARERQGE